ncbi:sulfatase [Purpureocillium lavendulum]|uniref:Sulfatase n=1 Tax=Purpureocillium lavendulum TaxID=1247861 RepID=A0AB34FTF1_9HYPO|nr:sulfatase [Purpureocillium lavendulum]
MDDLRGIDGAAFPWRSCELLRGTRRRRASSISLGAADSESIQLHCNARSPVRTSPTPTPWIHDAAKSPLLLMIPLELQVLDGKRSPSPAADGCPLLSPEPQQASALSPLHGWLVAKSDRESRLLGIPDSPDAREPVPADEPVNGSPSCGDGSSEHSSWVVVNYDSGAESQPAPRKRKRDMVAASDQEQACGREKRSKAPSPEAQDLEAAQPSPASSSILDDAAIPEHVARRLALVHEQLQPIGGLGDDMPSKLQYHRHVSHSPGAARINVCDRAGDRGRGTNAQRNYKEQRKRTHRRK